MRNLQPAAEIMGQRKARHIAVTSPGAPTLQKVKVHCRTRISQKSRILQLPSHRSLAIYGKIHRSLRSADEFSSTQVLAGLSAPDLPCLVARVSRVSPG